MKLESHCNVCLRLFGDPFGEVHQWLDEYATTPLGARHRRKRHHLEGVEMVRHRWGDRAAEAARQHLIDDLREEGWVDGNRFPVDEQDYVRMGLF